MVLEARPGQPLKEHLENVSYMAREFGEDFGMGDMSAFLGLIHDIGKYSEEFQQRLKGEDIRVDHSTAGGLEANSLTKMSLLANCILGHHGGLLNAGSPADRGDEHLRTAASRLKKKIGSNNEDIPDYTRYKSEIALSDPTSDFKKALGKFKLDKFSHGFLTRMLFSCLVDADFLDAERAMSGKAVRGGHDNVETLLNTLNKHLEKFANPTKEIHNIRNEILHTCIDKAKQAQGLFSLTVPTGGGKTLASMAFALNHAKAHNLKRIIYIIPYTSIIEQNAKVFAEIFGQDNVLENHCNAQYENDENGKSRHYLASENWDIPIVVTTNVQFFESLFGYKTSVCRKLHNISNSVLIFDEAQMLPVEYLKPCLAAINELVNNYKCTAVLCTATQPKLDMVFPGNTTINEICDNYKELYLTLKRVNYKNAGVLSDSTLAKELNNLSQVLCIVNTRAQAQNIYRLLKGEGVFHLSTLMCPVHRKSTLKEIRERLELGKNCRVVSTSLVEAGVDVDFPIVYRAKAGLDSIIQAGGRCNREGKRNKNESHVMVFEHGDEYKTPRSMELNISATKHAFRSDDIEMDSPEAIGRYFDFLYKMKGDSLDKKKIVERLSVPNIQFEDIAKDFNIIEQSSKQILIPYNDEAKKLIDRLKYEEVSRGLLRLTGLYSVSVALYEFEKLVKGNKLDIIDGEITILRDMSDYSLEMGLNMDFEPEKAEAIFV